jgi:hypothetical protein
MSSNVRMSKLLNCTTEVGLKETLNVKEIKVVRFTLGSKGNPRRGSIILS